METRTAHQEKRIIMSRPIKKISEKAGLPPETLIYVGEKRTAEIRITIVSYDEREFQEKEAKTAEECFPFKDKLGVTWINVDGVHQPEIVKKLGDYFGIHPLVLEDILNTYQRPKMDDLCNYIYIVLKMLNYNDERNEIVVEQISLILGPNFVISFQEKAGDVFNHIKEQIRGKKGRIREMGADYLAYALIDAIVDNYFIILEKFEEKIDFLEEGLVANPTQDTLQTIHGLKKDIMFLRKSVWPLRRVISELERGLLIQESTRVYLKDVYDHTIRIIDTVEMLRDTVSGILDVYFSSVSYKMNEVMKILTFIATIFIPLTFIVGIYGMNFKNMPELGWYWAYPLVLLVMLAIGISLIFYFRRKKWI